MGQDLSTSFGGRHTLRQLEPNPCGPDTQNFNTTGGFAGFVNKLNHHFPDCAILLLTMQNYAQVCMIVHHCAYLWTIQNPPAPACQGHTAAEIEK